MELKAIGHRCSLNSQSGMHDIVNERARAVWMHSFMHEAGLEQERPAVLQQLHRVDRSHRKQERIHIEGHKRAKHIQIRYRLNMIHPRTPRGRRP